MTYDGAIWRLARFDLTGQEDVTLAIPMRIVVPA